MLRGKNIFSYKFRLYSKKEQEERLLETLELCRQMYDYFLVQWNGKNMIPDRFKLQAQLPKPKKEKPELNKVYSNLKALLQLKKNGKKVGKLYFKSKGCFKTFVYNKGGFKLVKTGRRLDILSLSKIGDINIRVHRPIEGKIKQVIIKKHNSGRWFACIYVEKEVQVVRRELKKVIGIDVGVKHFLTDTVSRQIENPIFYGRMLEKIKFLQHWFSRKKKGLKNYEKQRIKLTKAYGRFVNQRDDFLHKLSKFYVNNYDVICVKNLNIKGIVRNHNLAQKILDASWKKFLQLLEYKAERSGVLVVKVDPRGMSEGLSYENPFEGLDNLNSPVEMRPLLVEVPASLIVEAGSPFRLGVVH